jgi:methyltransferase
MFGLAQWVVIAVGVLRIAELILSHSNTRNLLARGGQEFGRPHYPLFVLLHGGWLAAMFIAIPLDATSHSFLLFGFVALQFCRLWVIASLGPYWTTRIISAPDFPRIVRGPYRWVKHPNYIVVIAEIAILPLAFGAWEIAVLFSALNAALLTWRIKVEESALAQRRSTISEIVC